MIESVEIMEEIKRGFIKIIVLIILCLAALGALKLGVNYVQKNPEVFYQQIQKSMKNDNSDFGKNTNTIDSKSNSLTNQATESLSNLFSQL